MIVPVEAEVDEGKKSGRSMILPIIGVGLVLLVLSQCGRERMSYAEIRANAERQVEQEDRIAKADGEATADDREIEEYPYRR